MAERFIENPEEVEKAVKVLRVLLKDIETSYMKSLPYSDYAMGYSYGKLIDLCTETQDTMYSLGELVEKTIEFLSGSSEMFAKNDRTNAESLKRVDSTTASSVDYNEVAARKAAGN